MLSFLLAFLIVVRVFARSRTDTALGVLALPQQLGVINRKRSRPRLDASDRLFWVLLRQLWSRWAEAHYRKPRHRRRLASCRFPSLLALEVPAARWPTENHRRNSRPDPAPGTRKSGLGCSKIHGELRKLGFRSPKGAWHDIYGLWCAGAIRAKRGLGFFLRNHREAIVGLELFTVPTVTFRVLYCLFVIGHGRRRILHFNVTRHPSADSVVQQ